MNWKHGSCCQAEEDGDEDDEADDDERDRGGDNQGLIVDRRSTDHHFSFERETRCSKRFPRRRGRLDKAEEAE